MEAKTRHHLRSDDVEAFRSTLHDQLGVDLSGATFELVKTETAPFDLILVDGTPTGMYYELGANDEGESDGRVPFLTVKGANATEPTQRLVTVDTGAISFVSDGADVMRPGIADADTTITAGDLVVIIEEAHGKALAIGRSRVDGTDLIGEQGKVIDSIHHVGDELYTFTP